MKKNVVFIIAVLFFGCNTDTITNAYYKARVVQYDYNCAICIIEFSDNLAEMIRIIGTSENGLYNAANMNLNDYLIGQEVDLLVREPKTDELKPCITLYPSHSYKNLFVSEVQLSDDLILNSPLKIKNHDCLSNADKKIAICVDSVNNDSRCPTGTVCVWAGDATVRFSMLVNNTKKTFALHTNSTFQTDTIIDNYKIKLSSLTPYPSTASDIKEEDYTAEILVKEL